MADILSLAGETGRQTTRRAGPPVGGFVLWIYKDAQVRQTARTGSRRMEIALRIDCTPTEARQMLGVPDLLPLYECFGLALEDWLVAVIARLDPLAFEAGAAAGAGRGDDRRERTGR